MNNGSLRTDDTRRDNLHGIGAMILAVASLSAMDACLKTLSPHYPAFQVTALRALSALPIVLPWIWFTTGFRQLVNVRPPLHIVRGFLGVTSLTAFTYGVRTLPLTEAYALFFVAPVFITILAALLLHEHVERARWIAIILGFAGVLIVLQPTGAGAVSVSGLAILGCAFCYALSAICVRVLGRTDSTQSMVFWLIVFMAIGSGALAYRDWRPIEPAHWIVLAALSIAGSVGQWALTEAFSRGESSVIAPFEYTALVWGVSLDWVLWRTVPGMRTLAGAAVVIASGVYLVRRERVHVEAEHP